MYIGGIVGSGIATYCSFDGIINANIEGTVSELNIGGIYGAGYSASSYETEYCHTAGKINVSLKDIQLTGLGACHIGGIGAEVASHSYNAAEITVNIDGMKPSSFLGFLWVSGVATKPSAMTSCYNTGNITVTGTNISESMPMVGIGGITSSGGANSIINYCYNTGTVNASGFEELTGNVGVGSIIGLNQAQDGPNPTLENVYYVEGTTAIGKNVFDNTGSIKGLISKEENKFKSGEIAHALRDKGGYGQNLDEYGNAIDETPVLLCFAGDEQKVHKLTLKSKDITTISGDIYRNAEPAKLLQKEVYDELMADAEEGKDLIWKNTEGEVVAIGNDYTPSTDEKLMAEWGDVYTITTEVKPTAEAGIVEVSKTKAQEGETISFTVTENEGYELASITGVEYTKEDNTYTFTMPASNVTITATFEKEETGDDDEDEGGISTKRYQLFLADRDFNLNDKYDAEGLVLFSRHDKRYAEVGGSFTVYYEKDGEVNAGDYRIFWSKSANGEYKEVKLDEVSGYYQIRNVQSDVYVKIYGRDGFPVSNEAIEATEARAYAQANKIIVVTHEPMDVQIVSMAGAVVGNAKVAGQQEFGNLAEGVYIVRLGDTVVKLQVRN